MLGGKRILLGVTGSVAAYKAVQLASDLVKSGALVDVALTRGALEFLTPLAFRALTHRQVLTSMFDPNQPEALEHVTLAREVDGVVVAAYPPVGPLRMLQAVRHAGIPLALAREVDLPMEPSDDGGGLVASVEVDFAAGARMAVRHLLELGHRRIAFLCGANPPDRTRNPRYRGYCDALQAAGLEVDPALVFGRNAEESDSALQGYHGMRELWARRTGMTAVVAYNDLIAMGVLAALHEAKVSVPGDVSVVSFDDIPLSAFTTPPLTTVHIPAYEQGVRLVNALTAVSRQRRGLRDVLATRLVVRGSTAPPAAPGGS